MNSITNVVTLKYGPNDEPEPVFACPVVVDPTIRQVLKETANPVDTIISEAACAVELVSRFEGATRYVDFAPRLALTLAEGERPIRLRITLVHRGTGHLARIDVSDTV